MRMRRFGIESLMCVGVVALSIIVSSSALAQTNGARDRLSGTWVGYIGPSPAEPYEISLKLSFAADGSLSGTAQGANGEQGKVESGTFDRATGALKFTVLVGDGGESQRAYFDGKVVHDTASGTLRLGSEQHGIFRIVRENAAAPRPAPAAPVGDAGAAVRRGLVEVSDWLLRAAEMVPEERYSYRPVGSVRTFGQLVAHVVDGSNYYCARAAGRNVEWSDATERTVTTRTALVQALRKSLAECKTVYEGAGQVGPMMENLVHDGLHYGNMVTYLRMMGLVPPSSG